MHGLHNIWVVGMIFLTMNIFEQSTRADGLANFPGYDRKFSLILL